nr:flagellar biosynthetic protein FliO [uncultured Massilia sp.]
MRRLLTILAVGIAFPLAASAVQQGGATPPAGPTTQARNDDAGTKPASVVPAPDKKAAPVAPAQQPAAPVLEPTVTTPRAAVPDATSSVTGGTTVGDPGTGADATLPTTPAQPATTAPVAPATAPVTMPSGSATGSLLQTLFALVAVLALLAGLAWVLKRYGPKAGGGTANLRIVGSLNLGGRERLLVVEVGDQWIVVGASPGRVNALATMPRQESAGVHPGGAEGATLAPHAPAAGNFADWLKQTLDKRK